MSKVIGDKHNTQSEYMDRFLNKLSCGNHIQLNIPFFNCYKDGNRNLKLMEE